jgi:hypothetical protein
MFGKLEVHASEVVWRFKPITFHSWEMRVKLILVPHALLKFRPLSKDIKLITFLLLDQLVVVTIQGSIVYSQEIQHFQF